MFKNLTCEKIKGMLEVHIYSAFFGYSTEDRFIIEMKRGSNTAISDVIEMPGKSRFVEVNSSLTCDATFFYSKSDKKFIEKKVQQRIKSVDRKGQPDKTLARWEYDIATILNNKQLEISIQELNMKIEGGKNKDSTITLDTIIQMTMDEADIKKQKLTELLSDLMNSKVPLEIPEQIEEGLNDTYGNAIKQLSKKELIRQVEQLREENAKVRQKCKDYKEKLKNMKKSSTVHSNNLSVISEIKSADENQFGTDMSYFINTNMPSRNEMETQLVQTKNDLAMLIDRIADTKNWNILNPIREQLNFLREDQR